MLRPVVVAVDTYSPTIKERIFSGYRWLLSNFIHNCLERWSRVTVLARVVGHDNSQRLLATLQFDSTRQRLRTSLDEPVEA